MPQYCWVFQLKYCQVSAGLVLCAQQILVWVSQMPRENIQDFSGLVTLRRLEEFELARLITGLGHSQKHLCGM